MLLRPKPIKDFILKLLKKYKEKYKIRIYEFIIMDNHAHFIFGVADSQLLGDFMRTVNSQIARFINHTHNRDSQAIRERYKSPLIDNDQYFVKTMQYIWLNRIRVKKKSRPQYDPFCSLSYRLTDSTCDGLLDDYDSTTLNVSKSDIANIFEQAMKLVKCKAKAGAFAVRIFESSHTIASKQSVDNRRRCLLDSLKSNFSPHSKITG